MTHRNVLILLSDEHNADIMGCAGHPLVQTPNLDALARASIATGRHVHEHRCWDNAIAYEGTMPSWGIAGSPPPFP